MKKDIKSPCIKVCKYDEEGNCIGCYRTMTEISAWLFMTDDQKIQTLEDAAIRKKTPRAEKNNYDYYV